MSNSVRTSTCIRYVVSGLSVVEYILVVINGIYLLYYRSGANAGKYRECNQICQARKAVYTGR